jgi:flotillin
MDYYLIGAGILATTSFLTTVVLRRVVPTNEMHIIQARKNMATFGQGSKNGNVYYEWPKWMPLVGITKAIMPISVFKLELMRYDAYDKDRLPFEIDLVAFFRIDDFIMASQRVSSLSELREQLLFILKGAARTMLANYDIHQIMVERATFGDHFTKEVETQLKNWGCSTVKNIVIENIMAKTKSLIEMQSRTVVAKNMQEAQTAEIQAQQEVDIRKQEATQAVGLKQASREQTVGIAAQQASQAVKEQERVTKEKEMNILQVSNVRQSEIAKQANIIKAEERKQVAIVEADGEKQKTVLLAEGNLENSKRIAEGIQVQGLAKAEAEKAMQLAPVQAQITLAKEIGSNENYQKYLVTIRQVEANQVVGVEQAKALEKANIKIIANTGNPVEGVKNAMEIFSAKGGTQIGSMLEALVQTPTGEKIIDSFSKGNGHA